MSYPRRLKELFKQNHPDRAIRLAAKRKVAANRVDAALSQPRDKVMEFLGLEEARF